MAQEPARTWIHCADQHELARKAHNASHASHADRSPFQRLSLEVHQLGAELGHLVAYDRAAVARSLEPGEARRLHRLVDGRGNQSLGSQIMRLSLVSARCGEQGRRISGSHCPRSRAWPHARSRWQPSGRRRSDSPLRPCRPTEIGESASDPGPGPSRLGSLRSHTVETGFSGRTGTWSQGSSDSSGNRA
jgi:hypothetical protein